MLYIRLIFIQPPIWKRLLSLRGEWKFKKEKVRSNFKHSEEPNSLVIAHPTEAIEK